MSDMARYADSPTWRDIEPLPQDDGGPDALATIAYTEEYREAISYLRAIMAAEEFSPRVMDLTEHVIELNPAHYTVWLYRAKTLKQLGYSITDELLWLNGVALAHIKNYQIWHHRQTLITRLAPPTFDPSTQALSTAMKSEIDFLNEMLDKDAKNYHVWSYRQWLVREFGLWDDNTTRSDKGSSGELEETSSWLRRDIRNNSAWNHRYFVVFGNEKQKAVSQETYEREIQFAQKAITIAPQNESSWNYLKAVMKKHGQDMSNLKQFVEAFARFEVDDDLSGDLPEVDTPQNEALDDEDEFEDVVEGNGVDSIRSSFALSILADIYAKEKGSTQKARRALELLREKYDPIRANYWNWKINQLERRTSQTST